MHVVISLGSLAIELVQLEFPLFTESGKKVTLSDKFITKLYKTDCKATRVQIKISLYPELLYELLPESKKPDLEGLLLLLLTNSLQLGNVSRHAIDSFSTTYFRPVSAKTLTL